ncbi:DUF732 domain-containing protein [Mycobacterium syngnathidarum]
MLRTLAAIAVSSLMMAHAAPAHANPGYVDPDANHSVFLQAVAGDGIVIDRNQAIREGYDVCKLMRVHDASLWDAAQNLVGLHPDWGVELAMHFANRSVQNICPHQGSF